MMLAILDTLIWKCPNQNLSSFIYCINDKYDVLNWFFSKKVKIVNI